MPPQYQGNYQDDYFSSGSYYPQVFNQPGAGLGAQAGAPATTLPATQGAASVPGATPGAAPYTPQIPGAGQAGFINAPDPFQEQTRGLVRAARMAGVNLGGFSPAAQAIAKKSGELINELALALGNNPGMVDSAANMLETLAGIIRKGVAGGKIFGGNVGGAQQLAQMAAGFTSNPQPTDRAGAFAASLLADPEQASKIFAQAQFGGMAPSAIGPVTRSLLSVLDRYYEGLETGAIPQATPNSFLDYLLGNAMQPAPTETPGAIPGDIAAQRARAQAQVAAGGGQAPYTTPGMGAYSYPGR